MEIRRQWLKSLGGTSSISVKNKEWVVLLEEETRHSLMIEGHVVSKQELRQILGGGSRNSHSRDEVLAYHDAAVAAYELANAQYKENDFQITKAHIRQFHALMFRGVRGFRYDPGAWRLGPITIAQSKVKAPPASKVDQLLGNLLKEINKPSIQPIRKAALLHAFFEQIHPFPDGNGRVGRILQNYVLIGHGMPNIAIKGLEIEKKEYFNALENADPYVADVLNGRIKWSKIGIKSFVPLEELISKNLAEAIDIIICTRYSNHHILMSIKDIASRLGYNYKSFQTACSQHKYICMKDAGRLFTHPDLLKSPPLGVKVEN